MGLILLEGDQMNGIRWLLQMLTGIALVGFLGYHLVVTHITGGLEYEEVMKRFDELKLFYAVFVIMVVYHAFNGLKIIAKEYVGEKVGILFDFLLIIALAYGLFLLVTV